MPCKSNIFALLILVNSDFTRGRRKLFHFLNNIQGPVIMLKIATFQYNNALDTLKSQTKN